MRLLITSSTVCSFTTIISIVLQKANRHATHDCLLTDTTS